MSIATLVPELLCMVFLHHRALYLAGPEHDKPAYSWIHIAHVSQYWRAVALSCPELWTYIPLVSPQCVETMLYRSGQARLKLILGHRGDDTNRRTASFRLALGHLHRIGEVQLRGVEDVCTELDTLRDAPVLERLVLDRYSFMWTDTIFQQHRLKELVLQSRSSRFSSFVQVQEMLSALKAIPTLEALILMGIMPTVSPTWAEWTAITLPRLKFFHVWDMTYEICLLLNKIICPTTTMIHLELRRALTEELTQLVGSISSKLRGETAVGAVQPLHALDIGQDDQGGYIHVRGWTTTRPINYPKVRKDSPGLRPPTAPASPDYPTITLSYHHRYAQAPPGALDMICNGLPLSTVQTFSIGPLPKASLRLIRWATHVETLWISGLSVQQILDARILDLPEQFIRTHDRQHLAAEVSFPQLMTVRLEDSEARGDVERLSAVVERRLCAGLKVLLDLRHKYGGLKLLILRQFDELATLYDDSRGTDPNVLSVQRLPVLM